VNINTVNLITSYRITVTVEVNWNKVDIYIVINNDQVQFNESIINTVILPATARPLFKICKKKKTQKEAYKFISIQ